MSLPEAIPKTGIITDTQTKLFRINLENLAFPLDSVGTRADKTDGSFYPVFTSQRFDGFMSNFRLEEQHSGDRRTKRKTFSSVSSRLFPSDR
jgi:hypothetical protein